MQGTCSLAGLLFGGCGVDVQDVAHQHQSLQHQLVPSLKTGLFATKSHVKGSNCVK